MRAFKTHGAGTFTREELATIGHEVVLEAGVLVWHPETISLGENVYIGHRAMLKGHPHGTLSIGNDTWVGQDVFIHSGGTVRIGQGVGIGPRACIFTSAHRTDDASAPILAAPLEFKPVVIEDGADIGVGAILLPGVTVGHDAQVGAGSVVTTDVPSNAIVAGNPARLIRMR